MGWAEGGTTNLVLGVCFFCCFLVFVNGVCFKLLCVTVRLTLQKVRVLCFFP